MVPLPAGNPQPLGGRDVDTALLPAEDQLKLSILRTMAPPPIHQRRQLDLSRLHLFIRLVHRFQDTVDWCYLVRSLADAGWGSHYRANRHVAHALFGPVPALHDVTKKRPPRWYKRLATAKLAAVPTRLPTGPQTGHPSSRLQATPPTSLM